jgi:hypothetical protein
VIYDAGMGSWRWAVALSLLVAAAGLTAFAWYATVTAQPATGPHKLVWRAADGSPIPDDRDAIGCEGEDITLTLAHWHHGLLVPCDNDSVTGWAFLDPERGEATVRWPAPVRRGGVTHSIVPGPDHQLVLVYGDIEDHDLSVGFANATGWARAPQSLGHVRYAAAAWVDAKLEVVVTELDGLTDHGTWFTRPYTIVSVAPDGITRRVVTATCVASECSAPGVVYRAAGHWLFEEHTLGAATAITETGDSVPPRFSDVAFGDELDRSAQGTLAIPAGEALGDPTVAINADGTRAPPQPRPPGVPRHLVDMARYEIDDHGIRRRPGWHPGEHHATTLEVIDGRSLLWGHDRDDNVRAAASVEQLAAVRPVARWSAALGQRTFVPDGHDGYWLLDVSGEYIHLDHALARTDALPLREHLRQRGSLGTHIDEPEHEHELGWVLFGFPITLVGVCGAFGWRRTTGKLRWSMRPGVLGLACCVYLVSAAYELHAVWHLLT